MNEDIPKAGGLSNWYVEELETFLPQVNITPALVQNEIHPYYQENDVISEIAQAHGKSSAQIILRWNLQKGVVVIPGSSNPDHIQENTELFPGLNKRIGKILIIRR